MPVETATHSSTDLGNSLTIWEKLALVFLRFTHLSSAAVVRARITQTHPGMWGNLRFAFLEEIRRFLVLILNGAFPFLPGAKEAGLGMFSLSTHICSCFLKQISAWLYPKTHTYILGQGAERQDLSAPFKVCTLNGCMFWGGLPIKHGGLRPAPARIKPFSDILLNTKADLIVCQEICLASALKIIDELKHEYTHFFTDIAPFPWRLESCLFVASKLPIVSTPKLTCFPEQHLMKRSFFCVETPLFWVITTHMQPGYSKDAQRKRREQLKEINEAIQEIEESSHKPCLLMGDLNIERSEGDKDQYHQANIPALYHDLRAAIPLSPESATCTNLLMEYAYGHPVQTKSHRHDWEINDYALVSHKQAHRFSDFHVDLIHTFELTEEHLLKNPSQAVSDHRGLLATFSLFDRK